MRAISVVFLAILTGCTTTAPAPTTPDKPTDAPAAHTDAATTAAGTDAPAAASDATDDSDAGTADAALPTMEKLNEAKGKVHAMMGKAAAMDAVKPILGDPATSSDSEATWIAKDGDNCQALKVQLMGDMVGNVNVAEAPCPTGAAE